MACRVGVTTSPDRKKAYWEEKMSGVADWTVLREFISLAEAEEYEAWYADRYGCQRSPIDGGDEGSRWYVYRFDYTPSELVSGVDAGAVLDPVLMD